MKDETTREAAVRDAFANEKVPYQIHAAIVKTCSGLPEKQRRTGRGWKVTLASCGTVAAVFVALCCTNAVNPAFAESIPLVGEAFRRYNREQKVSVGTYIGTYGEVSEVNSQAQGTDTAGLALTAKEAYSDGEYIHLSFTMDAPEKYLQKYYDIILPLDVEINGKKLAEKKYMNLMPEETSFVGTLAIKLETPAGDGETLSLRYGTGGLVGRYNDGGDSEDLPGSFTGTVSMNADTSHNRTMEIIGGSDEIQVKQVEATPSYTKISYEIPFWGISGWVADHPRLYTVSGEPIRGSRTDEDVEEYSPSNIPAEAKTVVATRFFDGLPNGTKQVILRFLDEDGDEDETGTLMYYPSTETGGFTSKRVRVLGEVTIDLSTGEAVPSETYLDAGIPGPSGYLENFSSLKWSVVFDELFPKNNVHNFNNEGIFAEEELFQNGFTLSGLGYDKAENRLAATFYTTEAYEKDLAVTVAKEDGAVIAQGTLTQDHWHDNDLRMYYDSEEEMLADQDRQIEESYCLGTYDGTMEYTKEERDEATQKMEGEKAALRESLKEAVPGQHYARASMTAKSGNEPKLLDNVTVRITDPDTGETVYERTVRLVRKEY